jgi:hypothetical protein
MNSESQNTDGGQQILSALWEAISEDVKALLGDDVAVTVTEHDSHLDVRIIPNGAVEEQETKYEDLTVVSYNACQVAIRKEDVDDGEADA